MTAVSDYGIEISGTTTERNARTNAPIGHTWYDTTLRKLCVMGPNGWELVGEEEQSSSSSSSLSSSSPSSLSSSSPSSLSSSSSSSPSSSSSSSSG